MSDVGDAPFHAHVYYEPAERPTAETLHQRLAAMPEVLLAGPMCDGAVGPHPIPQFEIHFLERALPTIRPVLEAAGLRILVHPLTHDDLADHTTLAHWIGAPVALDVSVLDPPGVNQGFSRFGKRDF